MRNTVLLLSVALLVCKSAVAQIKQPPSKTSTITATLTWDASISTNVAAYKVYWGTNTAAYTASAMTTNLQFAVTNLARGITWYFTATALTAEGYESLPAEPVSLPGIQPPSGLSIRSVVTTTLEVQSELYVPSKPQSNRAFNKQGGLLLDDQPVVTQLDRTLLNTYATPWQ